MMVHAVIRASNDPQNKINIYDMLLGVDGKMSLTKTAQFGSFAISTWGFVHLVVYNHLTEWYYTSYMVAWAGTQVLTYYISKSKNQPYYREDGQYSGQSQPGYRNSGYNQSEYDVPGYSAPDEPYQDHDQPDEYRPHRRYQPPRNY